MSLSPTIYRSTDIGAPQLSGQAGSLLNLLRAVLVTGYGAGGNTKPGLGWVEAFTGVNRAAFRLNPISGSGYRLRVVDDGSSGGDARAASLRGYAEMIDLNNGTGATPAPSAQYIEGAVWPKSSTLDSTERGWWLIGNERCFYLFVDLFSNGIDYATPQFAGDIVTAVPGDRSNFAISIYRTFYSGSGAATRLFSTCVQPSQSPDSSNGLLIAKNAAGDVTTPYIGVGALKFVGAVYSPFGGSTFSIPYPAASGGVYFDSLDLVEGVQGNPRGAMPGVYAVLHNRPFSDRQQLASPDGFPSGTTILAKTFRTDDPLSPSNFGQVMFDITNAW